VLLDALNNPAFWVSFAALQAVVLLVAIRLLDLYGRQPLSLLTLMFAWGATGAALIAVAGNRSAKALLDEPARTVFGNAISVPLVEEGAKGLALLAAIGPLRWVASRLGVAIFEGVSSGIVFGAAVGLGFAFTEDLFYLFDQARVNGLQSGFDVFVHRRDFFGPAVLHHPVFTAAFGAGLGAAAWSTSRVKKVVFPLLGFAVAVLMHAANNGLVEAVLALRYGLDRTAAWLNGLVVLPELDETAATVTRLMRLVDFYFLALFVLVMVLWLRYQRRVIREELAGEVEAGLLDQGELETASSFKRRTERDWRLVRTGQLERWRHLRRLQAGLVELAMTKWRVRRFGGDQERVHRLRRQLATLATFDVRKSNLPRPATPLLGRDRELDEVRALLAGTTRLMTLTGPGGTGKTRLSLEVAARLVDDFPSGVFFVDLAAAQEPALVVAGIAEVLEVTARPDEPLEEALADYLRDKQLLLVLDNLEQVEAAGIVSELLRIAQRIRFLATSRRPLTIRGEHEYALSTLDQEPSVELFAQRARAVEPSFELTEAYRPAVTEICAKLDGLPLAVELAAARVRVLTPPALLERLDRSLAVLTGGAEDLPGRHQTLRDTIAWSYGMLGSAEQELFDRLSVFVGGFTLEAAEAASGGDVLNALDSLVAHSLVKRDEVEDGALRFRMLETIREYAGERLRERGEEDELRRGHAEWFTSLAEEAEAELLGPHQAEWLRRLSYENDNIRAALAWSIESGRTEPGLRLAGALVRFWSIRGQMGEGRDWLARALAAADGVPAEVHAKALFAAGYAALGQGDFAPAEHHFEESLDAARTAGDKRAEGAVLAQLAWLAAARAGRDSDAAARARQLAEQSLERARAVDDRLTISGALNTLGDLAAQDGDETRAASLYEESLALRRGLGDERLIANSLLNLGRLEVGRGELDRAEELLGEGLGLARGLGDTWSISVGVLNLGRIRLLGGESAAANELLAEAARLAHERGDRRVVSEALQGLAVASLEGGDADRAARLWGAAAALLEETGAAPTAPERELESRFLPRLRETLGEDAFERLWAQGRELSAEDAVETALGQPAVT
jgi:predicted ATPase/RsiW-degrading membrane proteinase PrsW (M82 family)